MAELRSFSSATPSISLCKSRTMFWLLLLLLLCSTQATSLNQEGLYLLEAKSLLSDPAQSLATWNSRDLNPCSWRGITCNTATHQINSIDLSDFQLAGSFPLVLCRLPYLSSLSLFNNLINSSLPAGISTCQALKYLNLSQNLLAGTIPGSLSEIPNLQQLDLSYNSFSEMEAGIGASPRLEMLCLINNLLVGSIPLFLFNITTLKKFQLAYNPFSPSELPSQASNLTQLEDLWLSNCNLVGEIPDSIRHLSLLTNLDLSTNRLTGPIPTSLFGLKNIVQIELFNNSLSGLMPAGFTNLTSLRRFDVSTNDLSGTIPDDLCELPLESLNLMENFFDGALPESIANSVNLYELKLFNNKLSGLLPSQLGKNSPLHHIDFSYNQFSGPIPEHICAKGQLEELILIYNEFNGTIPSSLAQCQSLLRIRLRHNRFSGSVPDGIWGLNHVSLLDLVDNSFSGQISSTISSAFNLSVFDISKNQFSGSIPDEIGTLSSLVEFSGGSNNFTGIIPDSVVQLKQLSKLDLSSNELSGEIPAKIESLTMLNELSLGNNKLSGEIPNEIGSLPVLNYLDLSSNYFSGKIPLELQNLKLNTLNLSNNRLSGDIPPIYAKSIYKDSFLGNPGLCGDLPGLCPKKGNTNGSLRYLWMLSLIFVLAGLVFIVGVSLFFCKYKTLKKTKHRGPISKWRSFHKLSFAELEITDCLKEDSVIGSGASGKVYKVELSNGEIVAVKKLWGQPKNSGSEKDEFQIEVDTLGKIRHKNIVRLLCCCKTLESKLLVYEYMENGSLGDKLHGGKGSVLDWPTRYKVAVDAAEGLSYLHHDCVPPIVHRDVKSNNILLDEDFGAKVADFGVAKMVWAGKGEESMSVIAGSCGYIAPEYAYTLRVNEKSDIYSFGVVLLELITGKPPIDPSFGEKDIVRWIITNLDQTTPEHIIDPNLGPIYRPNICRVLDIALRCTNSLPINRPSMRKVVKLLIEIGSESQSTSSRSNGKLSPYYYEFNDTADP